MRIDGIYRKNLGKKIKIKVGLTSMGYVPTPADKAKFAKAMGLV